jgi:tetratricopeptide (TPR) repeat protein
MKNIFFIGASILIMVNIASLCSAKKAISKESENKKRELVVEIQDGVVHVGDKKDVEEGMKTMRRNDLVDPAYDYAILARNYYDEGNYEEAEKQCLKALKDGKKKIVFRSARRTLSYVYEATGRYDLAIKEIDWLLENVNVHAKPALVEKRKELQKLIDERKSSD